MKDIDAGLKYLNRDYLINVDMIEPILHKMAEVVYASDECVLIRDLESDVYMIATDNLGLADKLTDELPPDPVIVARTTELAEFLKAKFGCKHYVPCYQAVYLKERPQMIDSDIEMRLMREDEAELASELYGSSLDNTLTHIRLGLIYGGYVGGEFAAMVGMHIQGSMGLLEVKEQFRRKHYAETLERFLINKVLDSGRVPFCQIIEDNEPSLCLQRKLGFEISKNKLYWMHKGWDKE